MTYQEVDLSPGESLFMQAATGELVEVKFIAAKGFDDGLACLGINAPVHVPIRRGEVTRHARVGGRGRS